MRDVAERPGVHQHRRALQRLQQVGLDRFAHDHRHRPGSVQILRRHRLSFAGLADHDPAQPGPHVL